MFVGAGRLVTVLRRGRLLNQRLIQGGSSRDSYRASNFSSSSFNTILNRFFQEAYLKLCFTVKTMIPCQVMLGPINSYVL
jgi:hypothetical protein